MFGLLLLLLPRAAAVPAPDVQPCHPSHFDAWAATHGSKPLGLLGDGEERALRLSNFCATRSVVEAHNRRYAAGESSYFMELNAFSAYTPEEWGAMMGYRGDGAARTERATVAGGGKGRGRNVSSVDWRQHGKVSSVKNQGQCGGCWAFSAIGAIEGAVSIAENFTWNASDTRDGYSVDQCLECTPGALECEGGYPWLCFSYVIANGGIDSERDWPYLSEGCDDAKEKYEKVAAISAFGNITDGDEPGLQTALARQPVSVAVRANCDSFKNYGGGVLDDDCGGGEQQIDHAILAVGYNLSAPTPYYIVKNSWGSSWGEGGYLRMAVGSNLDGIASKATYPVAAKAQPGPPAPEVACPAGTFDPSLKKPPSCPKGSGCCCTRTSLWKKECKETTCCLEGEACLNQGKEHGCVKKNGTAVSTTTVFH